MRVHAYFMYIFLVQIKLKKKKKKRKGKEKGKESAVYNVLRLKTRRGSSRLSQLQLLAIVFLQQTLSIHMPVKRKPVHG